VVVYSKHHNEIWMVGDCQCLIGDKLYMNTKIVDEIAANARALYLELELIIGKTKVDLIEFDSGREFIMPLLKRQSFFQNSHPESSYSYGAIDGFEVDKSAIKIIKVESNTKYLILASDGYPQLLPSLEASEKMLQKILREDPLFIKNYKSTKGLSKGYISYDDRAYLKIKL
jgi:hypothetical protein